MRIFRPTSWGSSLALSDQAETTSLTHTFSGLTAGLSYYVDVKAWVDVGGSGYWTGWSDGAVTILTAAAAVPDAPAAPTLEGSATTRSITFRYANPTLDHNSQISSFVLTLTNVDTGVVESPLTIITSAHPVPSPRPPPTPPRLA